LRGQLFVLALSALLAGTAGAQPAKPPASHRVIELRQYKLVAAAQDSFIALFDRQFVETQEALGMRLVGQFHDHDRRDRFTWIREFPDMPNRARMLDAFYNGPVWQKYRGTANPMLDDNDNVLLLREARAGSGFGPSAPHPDAGAVPGHPATIFAVIEYLWKDPNEGFADFFLDEIAPRLARAGLPVLGAYVPEEEPNNFPRLPVRPDRKILVWFTSAESPGSFDLVQKRLQASRDWKQAIAARLDSAEERPPQVLRLDPTPRSALR
jgi:hypothetical protein